MDPAHCLSENPTTPRHPRVVFRERHQDDDAPPFFVHFEHGGKTMTLNTPTTRESYSAVPLPTTG